MDADVREREHVGDPVLETGERKRHAPRVGGCCDVAVAERDFRLDDLARHARLSLSHFKKRFRTETGLSPRQFILRDKIEAAKRVLCHQDTSVTNLALDLGFVSSQYFATVFKRITGLTPSDYRGRGELPQPSQRSDDGQS
jgi:AraC-like DNA-binding protein